MNKYFAFLCLFICAPLLAGNLINDPINKSLYISSPIASNDTDTIEYPENWLNSHIKCTVYNSQPNDIFIVYNQEVDDGYIKNIKVDGKLVNDGYYFKIDQPGTHNFEFDVLTPQYSDPPNGNLNLYNGSTEALQFSDCIATSE